MDIVMLVARAVLMMYIIPAAFGIPLPAQRTVDDDRVS